MAGHVMNDDFAAREPAPIAGSSLSAPPPTWGWKAMLVVTFIVALVPLAGFLAGDDTDEEEIERDVLILSGVISLIWYAGIASVVYFAARWTGGGWPNLGFRPGLVASRSIFARVRN